MAFRCPSDESEPDRKAAESAIKMTATVLEFVLQRLPVETPGSEHNLEEE